MRSQPKGVSEILLIRCVCVVIYEWHLQSISDLALEDNGWFALLHHSSFTTEPPFTPSSRGEEILHNSSLWFWWERKAEGVVPSFSLQNKFMAPASGWTAATLSKTQTWHQCRAAQCSVSKCENKFSKWRSGTFCSYCKSKILFIYNREKSNLFLYQLLKGCHFSLFLHWWK